MDGCGNVHYCGHVTVCYGGACACGGFMVGLFLSRGAWSCCLDGLFILDEALASDFPRL